MIKYLLNMECLPPIEDATREGVWKTKLSPEGQAGFCSKNACFLHIKKAKIVQKSDREFWLWKDIMCSRAFNADFIIFDNYGISGRRLL